jgi:ATP-dependent DNA helicase DinG
MERETLDAEPAMLKPPLDYFPMAEPRDKQLRALDFLRRAHAQKYTDIVIEAPTGIGKTGIGAAAALWAQQLIVPGKFEPGAYYLVTQKLLQDQLEADIDSFKAGFRRGCTLKSSIEYNCAQYGTCMAGMRMKHEKRCRELADSNCSYRIAKSNFRFMPLAVTNYPYFFTERTYVGELPPRRVLVADECHTLEKQVLGFVEVNINHEVMTDWAPHLRPVPRMDDIFEFADWLTKVYMPVIENRIIALNARLEDSPEDRKLLDEVNKAETHYTRNQAALRSIYEDENNWIYWQEEKENGLESIAKPISAAAFMKFLIFDAASIRIYMSAYPGPKEVFCRSLGLNVEKVAWLKLASTFPIENRPVHMVLVGSMGQKSIETTLPSVLRMAERILKAHSEEKGLIHCHSYKIGQALFDYLNPRFPGRIIFPKTAKERDNCFAHHSHSEEPTVMLSPSMTEGFNLIGDLARFQIIAKMPYPYLGDKQVAAKRERDPDWYSMQTAMTVIQACGRIVRSDTDTGATYILDSDFKMLYERHPHFFPRWFEEAFVWHKK